MRQVALCLGAATAFLWHGLIAPNICEPTVPTRDQLVAPSFPRTVHQIWIDRYNRSQDVHRPPQYVQDFASQLKSAHERKGWRVHRWGNELWERYKFDALVQAYFRSRLGDHTTAYIVDYLKLLVLRDEGGVFVDIDAKPVLGKTCVTSYNRCAHIL